MSIESLWMVLALASGGNLDRPNGSDQEGQDLESRVARLEKENAELQRQVQGVSNELFRLDVGDVVGEVGESVHGLGPAASKVYAKSQGISIGGYGEALYQAKSGDTNEFDFLRAVLYFGYKFNEHWVLNTELEFEHASTGENGSVSVEFATIDYLGCEAVNGRVGLVLIPMGFLNELHEPTTFMGATQPETEQRIIPTTWRENGIGVFGHAGPMEYRAYVVNGFDGMGFSSDGLRGGRQKGSEALSEDVAVVARADWVDTPGVLAGGSIYHGDAGQGQAGLGNTDTTIWELHGEAKWRGLWARGLYAMAHLNDVAALNAAKGLSGADSVGEELHGGYLELGYDVLTNLAPESAGAVRPYVRYEWIDTQAQVPTGFSSDPDSSFGITSFGIDLQPIDGIVFKLEFQDFDGGGSSDRFNASVGYSF